MQIPEKVERWPIERVREYERNSRTHSASQVDRIAASMMEFGFTSPLLVDADDVLVAGHGRLAAAQKLGLNVLPLAGPGMVELHGLVRRAPASEWAWPDVEVWAWADATPEQRVQSVMKVTPGTLVLMPWQDAAANTRRPFVAGFDD